MKETDAIQKLTEAEQRARNGGINPQMPSHAGDVYGTKWKNEGPGHPSNPPSK